MFSKTDCTLCLGRRGSGKSFLARVVQKMYPRRVIFDTLDEYSESDGHVVRSFEDFCAELKARIAHPRFVLIYQFSPEAEKHDEEFNQALRILFYFGDVQIVIEEVQTFASPHFLPHWLRVCLLKGRHAGLSMLFTTQRPGELNKTILSQCSHIFAGSLHEKNDLAYVSSFLGVAADELTNLRERRFLYFRPGQPILRVNNTLRR